MAALSDEAKIRELAEIIRAKCAQAQQIRQQTPPGVTAVTSTSSANMLQVCIFKDIFHLLFNFLILGSCCHSFVIFCVFYCYLATTRSAKTSQRSCSEATRRCQRYILYDFK